MLLYWIKVAKYAGVRRLKVYHIYFHTLKDISHVYILISFLFFDNDLKNVKSVLIYSD